MYNERNSTYNDSVVTIETLHEVKEPTREFLVVGLVRLGIDLDQYAKRGGGDENRADTGGKREGLRNTILKLSGNPVFPSDRVEPAITLLRLVLTLTNDNSIPSTPPLISFFISLFSPSHQGL